MNKSVFTCAPNHHFSKKHNPIDLERLLNNLQEEEQSFCVYCLRITVCRRTIRLAAIDEFVIVCINRNDMAYNGPYLGYVTQTLTSHSDIKLLTDADDELEYNVAVGIEFHPDYTQRKGEIKGRGGHYTTYVKTDTGWYNADDTAITPLQAIDRKIPRVLLLQRQ